MLMREPGFVTVPIHYRTNFSFFHLGGEVWGYGLGFMPKP